MTTIRVLLVDDQADARRGFRTMLRAADEIEVVGEASSGDGVAELARRRAADVVLMDIRMPGVNGIEATRHLVATGTCRVLVLTTYDFDEYVFEALRAGAAGFLLKDVEPDDLATAIRTVAAGDGIVDPGVAGRLIARFAQVAPPAATPPPDLTPREHEVLLLVARGLSNADIAACLQIEASTVKRHVGALLSKLELRSRAQLIVFAFQHGLLTLADL